MKKLFITTSLFIIGLTLLASCDGLKKKKEEPKQANANHVLKCEEIEPMYNVIKEKRELPEYAESLTQEEKIEDYKLIISSTAYRLVNHLVTSFPVKEGTKELECEFKGEHVVVNQFLKDEHEKLTDLHDDFYNGIDWYSLKLESCLDTEDHAKTIVTEFDDLLVKINTPVKEENKDKKEEKKVVKNDFSKEYKHIYANLLHYNSLYKLQSSLCIKGSPEENENIIFDMDIASLDYINAYIKSHLISKK